MNLSRIKKGLLKRLYSIYDVLMNSDKAIRYNHFMYGFHNPNYTFKEDQIALVHVPKTGGTSLNKIIKESGDSRYVNLDIHKPISNTCSPCYFKYVTVMRDPIDRVWSQYQMVLRSENGYPYQKFARKGLKVFLDKCWAVRNMNCRYLTANLNTEPNNDTLKEASNNLSKFYAVLSFANFSTDLSSFLRENKMTHNEIPNERKSSYKDPTVKEIELIKQYNKLDITLFENWEKRRNHHLRAGR